ncbi:MAG: hypothetical protein LBO72_09920 [Helicobacteraceae bacterium]|jgi:hypothetical protein|nr:hypothetical protein [Helicobacteraceae bacterium]
MTEVNTFIGLNEIREFYKEKCEEVEVEFTENDFARFVQVCENDFFTWLKENWNYFPLEE